MQDLLDDEDNQIAILDDELDYKIVSTINQVPLLSGGMGGITSFSYEALKDLSKWNDLKPLKVFVPILMGLISYRISQINSSHK